METITRQEIVAKKKEQAVEQIKSASSFFVVAIKKAEDKDSPDELHVQIYSDAVVEDDIDALDILRRCESFKNKVLKS